MFEEFPYRIDFYEDATGRRPVLAWIQELPREERQALGTAMRENLQRLGVGVCGTAFGGKPLGNGLYEFRLREEGRLFRVFFHPYGDKRLLLLNGYDKQRDPSERRQQLEIKVARRNLRDWQARVGRKAESSRRR